MPPFACCRMQNRLPIFSGRNSALLVDTLNGTFCNITAFFRDEPLPEPHCRTVYTFLYLLYWACARLSILKAGFISGNVRCRQTFCFKMCGANCLHLLYECSPRFLIIRRALPNRRQEYLFERQARVLNPLER